jgi:hypothetical protein
LYQSIARRLSKTNRYLIPLLQHIH